MRAVTAAILAVGLLSASAVVGSELPRATPETHGFDSGKFAEILQVLVAQKVPIHSLLVVSGGEVILDAYFYPYDGKSVHDLASVTKSVTTSLIAIAAAEGKLDLDAPMLSYFPGRQVANLDARKKRITVRHLTHMTSGLACIGAPEEVTLAQMEQSTNFVQFALDLPMAAEPGTTFSYCSPGIHLLSAILTQATGESMFDYAREKLFEPLNITRVAWDEDPQGITRGWGDLHLSPPDMARLGELWLDAGTWEDKEIIPADWLKEATNEGIRSDRYEDYGYGFWIGPAGEPIPYFMASGRAGQRILMAPSLNDVFVTTGGGFEPGDVVEAAAGALVDPAHALPDNPAARARLEAALATAATAPASLPMPALPEIARAISGKTYRFEANPVGLQFVRIDFEDGPEATLTLADASGALPRAVGLDGVYRWSPGANGIPIGIAASWADEATLVLDYNTVADLRAYTITGKYLGDTVQLHIVQRDEPMAVTLTGRAE